MLQIGDCNFILITNYDLLAQKLKAANILSEHWPRAAEARLAEFERSNDNFPLHILLLEQDEVIGHCRLTQVQIMENVNLTRELSHQNFRFSLIEDNNTIQVTGTELQAALIESGFIRNQIASSISPH